MEIFFFFFFLNQNSKNANSLLTFLFLVVKRQILEVQHLSGFMLIFIFQIYIVKKRLLIYLLKEYSLQLCFAVEFLVLTSYFLYFYLNLDEHFLTKGSLRKWAETPLERYIN